MSENMDIKTFSKKLAVCIAAALFALLLFLPLGSFSSDTAFAKDGPPEIITINGYPCAADEVIIKFKDSASNENRADILDSLGGEHKQLGLKNVAKSKVPEDKSLQDYIAELNSDPNIEYAQPNYVYKLEVTLNDPLTYDTGDEYYQWFHDKINTFEAWDHTMGSGVTVAVLDTGAEITNPDLGDNITLIADIALEDLDGDGTGVSDGSNDDNGHGTHVTGIIAATADNSLGGAGVAPAADVVVYDVFKHYVYTPPGGDPTIEFGAFTDDIVEGIEQAVAYGAKVINMSLGGYNLDSAKEDAINYAYANGVVVVCSAGNNSTSQFHTPSDYENAISVIYTDENDVIGSSSNFGPEKDISAPGDLISSTYMSDSYALLSGTSMASPMVAGVCALILSADPALTTDPAVIEDPTLTVTWLKTLLYDTVDDLGDPGRDDYYGYGRVNAENAVLAAMDMVYKVELDQDTMTVEIGHTGTLTETIYPADATNQNVDWTSGDTGIATVSATGVVTGVAEGTTTITVTTQDGSYTDTCDVTVIPVAVTGISLDKNESTIIIGETDTLTATVTPEDAANKNVSWTSSNEAVATVEGGVVTSLTVGETNITVTTEDGDFEASCVVTVIPIPADGVTLNKSSTTLYEGASELLSATVSPEDAANKNITWESSDESVVTVDSSGMITAASELGGSDTATITVTSESGGFTDTCSITVLPISPASVDETIKVKLSINDPTYLYFYIDGNYSVQGQATALERQQYQVIIDGSTLKLYYGNSSTPIASGSTITLVQHASTGGNNFIWIDNYEYGPRGYLGDIVFSIEGGAIRAVNHVYMEDYLYGVVPHEMSDTWPAEALKAQAVAARTYAAASIGSDPYDVVDTSSDQVYKGYDDSKTNTITAVDGTAKTVLQYGNSITQAYYSASNGGYTDLPLHAWGSTAALPYAIYEDPYDVANAYSYYERIFFPAVIDGSHPVTVSSYVPDGTAPPNASNAIAYMKQRILAKGVPGAATVNDFELTGVLDLVPHTYDTDGGSEDHSLVPANGPQSGVNECVDFIMATGKFTVSVGGTSYEIADVELDLRYLDAANGITTYQAFNMSALRLFIIEGDSETGWSIYQRRYGHGVGMSQRGAQQRASDGQTYDQILAFYYPHASRVELGYTRNAFAAIESPADNSNAVVNCSDYLNVRSGPSTSYSIVGTLPRDARIQVLESGTWYKIMFGGVECYVHSDYVDLDDYVAVTGVSLDESSITLDVGDSQTLTATVSPSNATFKAVSWSTSDESVATVNASGEVTAVAGGTATITVTSDDDNTKTDTCIVTVEVRTTGVTLDESAIVIYEGKSETLTATVSPENATDKSVAWSSDDPGIASVADGVITGVSEGTTVIRAVTNDGSFEATCNVTVGAAPTDAIYSSVYTVNQADSQLRGVPDEITLTDMISGLDNSASDIVIRDSEGDEITDLTGFAGTGMTVQLVIDSSVVDELSIIVLGDVSGDGIINTNDWTLVRLDILDLLKLQGDFAIASDIDGNSEINTNDWTLVRLDILDLLLIN